MKFCDTIVQQRVVLCNNTAPPQLDTFIYKSQRPVEYGGTAPPVTKFWPPTMPEVTEQIDEKALNMVPRSNYISFI